MKRLISLALSVVMLLALTVPAASAAEVKPTPPDWVKAEEYAVIDGDPVYQSENWDRIARLRADAGAGHREPQEGDALYEEWTIYRTTSSGSKTRKAFTAGEWFERGLIAMKYAANSDTGRKASTAYWCFTELSSLLKKQEMAVADKARQLTELWYIRACFLNWAPTTANEALYTNCASACDRYIQLKKAMTIQLADVYDTPLMDGLPAAGRQRIEKEINDIARRVDISLDGDTLPNGRLVTDGREYRNDAVIVNGRTMVPIRRVAECLGADVEWVAATQSAKMTRAGVEIVMPIGSTTAYRNGVPFQMDTAPYVVNGATMIPVRYVAELFGQKVAFNSETRTVEIAENKSAVGDSNLEKWALAMGAMLNRLNGSKDPNVLGSAHRGGTGRNSARDYARSILNGDSWDITSRKDLINTVCRMTLFGHNVSFQTDAALVKGLSSAEYQQLLKNAQGMDKYMFPYTKRLSEKWGDRGILCWDLFRMSNLVQWGYLAGYVTYPEALALLEPAAALLHDNFKSWDEAYENYLDGYNWWARNNVLNQNIWETERGKIYTAMKADPAQSALFDDQLFKTPVKGVPGLTAEQVLASVQ